MSGNPAGNAIVFPRYSCFCVDGQKRFEYTSLKSEKKYSFSKYPDTCGLRLTEITMEKNYETTPAFCTCIFIQSGKAKPSDREVSAVEIHCSLPSEYSFVIISSVEPIKPYIRGGSRIFLGGVHH